ncbi:MAG: ImmA/IrrE family metallo-endopeptidase [Clostridium paraputrificum]
MIEKIKVNANAIFLRKQLKEDAYSPIDIFSLVNSLDNLTIVFYPMSDRISGMCVKVRDNNIVAINSKMTYGRQRFTMAHELCHLYFHKELNSVCAKDIENVKDEKEIEADMFASYFLAPYEALQTFISEVILCGSDRKLNLEDVVRIEQHFGLSRQAILNRLVSDGYMREDETYAMKSGIINSALRLGYDATLYTSSPENKRYFTMGKYVKMAEELNDNQLVSSGKYEELLLDAYRADIVFGLDDEEEMYD